MNTKRYFILIAVSIIVLFWAYSASHNVVSNTTPTTLLIPELAKNIDNIGTVIIYSKGKSFKVHSENDQWVIYNKYSYPVGPEKIRDLVQNSAHIKIIEAKTSNPESLDSIGLDNPEKESSIATRITLLSPDEKITYADYITGINRKGVMTEKRNEIYARLFNSHQSYLVHSDLNFDLGAHALLGGETFAVKSENINKINFNYSTNPKDNFTIAKNPGQMDFEIIEPTGMKLKAFGKVNALTTSLEYMQIEDIMPKESFPEHNPYLVITYKTSNNLNMEVNLFKVEDETWLTFNASTDVNEKQVTSDASRINELASNWVYKINPKNTDGFYYKLEDLLKD